MERWKLDMEVAVKGAALMLLRNKVYTSSAKRIGAEDAEFEEEGVQNNVRVVTERAWYIPQKTVRTVLATLRMYRDFLPRRARNAAEILLSLDGILSEKSVPESGLNATLWMRIQVAILDLLEYR